MQRRLNLTELETRCTPAGAFVIDGDQQPFQFFRDDNTIPGTAILRADAAGSVITPQYIEAVLQSKNVIIEGNSSVGPGNSGQVVWEGDSYLDDLRYLGTEPRSLIIRSGSGGGNPSVMMENVNLEFAGNLDLRFESPFTVILEGVNVDDARSIDVAAAITTRVPTETGTFLEARSGINFTGAGVVIGGYLQVVSQKADIDFQGYITVSVNGTLETRSGDANTRFHHEVYGSGRMIVAGREIILAESLGVTGNLSEFTIASGVVRGEDAFVKIRASLVVVGDYVTSTGASDSFLMVNVEGNVIVRLDGTLSPDGALQITSNLNFEGGTLAIEVGPVTESVIVGGVVNMGSSAQLRFVGGTSLPDNNAAIILRHFGQRFGTFANAPIGKPFLAGLDAVAVTIDVPLAGNFIAIQRVAGVPSKSVQSNEVDGTPYTVKLTGPGELIVVPDEASGRIGIVARGTSKQSNITVTSKAARSDRYVGIHRVSIQGDLGSFTADYGQLLGNFVVTGAVKSIKLDEAKLSAMYLHGTVNDATKVQIGEVSLFTLDTNGAPLTSFVATKTNATTIFASSVGKLKAANYHGSLNVTGDVDLIDVAGGWDAFLEAGGDVTTMKVGALNGAVNVGGKLGNLTSAADLRTDLLAAEVGTLKAAGRVTSISEAPWLVTGHVAKFEAGAIDGIDLRALSLGSLNVKGNVARGLAGDVNDSIFFTGLISGGNLNSFGIRTVNVLGTILRSEFLVPTSSVDSFSTGRMHDSRLYVGASPMLPGTVDLQFTTFPPSQNQLKSFKTTADPYNAGAAGTIHAFARSQVVAETLGTVRISSLSTPLLFNTFGVRYQSGTPSVRVAKADDPAIPLNKNLTASNNPLAGGFYFIDS